MSTNLFGGGNPNSLYVPMSDVEQEVLERLVEEGDLRIKIVGWGWVMRPLASFGDARLQLRFTLNFNRPSTPIPVYYFDLELWRGNDMLLFKERQSLVYGGNPVQVAAGVFLELAWDIAIQNIDPMVVKSIKPGALGLTSRLQDKDTKEITPQGNMKLGPKERKALKTLREGEFRARKDTLEKAIRATKKSLVK